MTVNFVQKWGQVGRGGGTFCRLNRLLSVRASVIFPLQNISCFNLLQFFPVFHTLANALPTFSSPNSPGITSVKVSAGKGKAFIGVVDTYTEKKPVYPLITKM